MKVTIELVNGGGGSNLYKSDLDKNIICLKRAIDGIPLSSDFIQLIDTISILKGIQEQLPD